jgi:hypothetical protein
MSHRAPLRLIAVALGLSLLTLACGKDKAAADAPAATEAKTDKAAEPAAGKAAAANEAKAGDKAEAADPAEGAAPAADKKDDGPLSVVDGPCPLPGEDAAACPKKPEKVDPLIRVAHVLVGYKGSLPGKAIERTKDESLALAKKLAHEGRKGGTEFIKLVWEHSSDPGPGVYDVTPATRMRYVPPFTKMAESLGVGQVDVVETRFGYHVMKRMPDDYKAPSKPLVKVVEGPCPLPGEDKAACPTAQEPAPEKTKVSHILVGYAGSLRGKRVERTKEEARKKGIELCHAARKKGADFAKLMKDNSEDPGPGTYDVTPQAGLVPEFKQLGLSLGVGQVDVVETRFGFHVIKRVE